MSVAFFRRNEVRLLALCMTLLAVAAGWLLSTRPGHKVEGDFYHREQTRNIDEWLLGQSRSHPIAERRALACLTLGRIGGEEARERLIYALEDEAPSVRAMAAFGLGLIGDVESGNQPEAKAAQALSRVLGDEDRRVVTYAVEAMGKMRWKAAAQAVASTPAPLVVTLTALARMDAHELTPWIALRLRSDDQDTRWAALVALGALRAPIDEELEQSFVRLSKDRNAFVRAVAVQRLALASPSEEVLKALDRALEDKDPKIRLHAVRSLGRLRQPDTVDMLRRVAEDPNPNVRQAVAEAAATLLGQAAFGQPRGPRDPRPTSDIAPELAEPFTEAELQEIARIQGRQLVIETAVGAFNMALDYENAPVVSERFWRMAVNGAFDRQPFASVRPGEYVQVAASPGHPSLRPQPSPQPFLRGSLGMVRASADADAPEFFVALTPMAFADSRYTNFGRLLSGDDLLDQITPETQILRIRPLAN